jgi:hypothetical protein
MRTHRLALIVPLLWTACTGASGEAPPSDPETSGKADNCEVGCSVVPTAADHACTVVLRGIGQPAANGGTLNGFVLDIPPPITKHDPANNSEGGQGPYLEWYGYLDVSASVGVKDAPVVHYLPYLLDGSGQKSSPQGGEATWESVTADRRADQSSAPAGFVRYDFVIGHNTLRPGAVDTHTADGFRLQVIPSVDMNGTLLYDHNFDKNLSTAENQGANYLLADGLNKWTYNAPADVCP